MPHAGTGMQAVSQALFVLVPVAVLGAYLIAASLGRNRKRWSLLRTLSFTLGIGLIVAAMSPEITAWAHRDLRGHMVQHLVLGMYAPIALVLGAPVTLLLRSVPSRAGRGIVRLLETGPVRFLVHPVTAAVFDVGGMYALYMTPLYALSLDEPALHLLAHVHFVLSGYLFTWAMIGPDPAPRRPGFRARLVVLLLAMAAHSTLAKLMYAYALPRVPPGDGAAGSGAMIMYYGGDVAEVVIAIALFAAWLRRRSRERRYCSADLDRRRELVADHRRAGVECPEDCGHRQAST